MSTKPTMIDPKTARKRVEAGEALLVCAYDDEQKCRENRLAGAITLAELESRSVDENQGIVFY